MRQDGAVISVVQDGSRRTPASSVHGISSGFVLLLINVCGGESTFTRVCAHVCACVCVCVR